MIEFLRHDFYLAIRELIINQKLVDDNECQRVNSFLIVNSKFDFSSDDINSRKTSPYFFSRNTQELLYPALFISELYDTYDDQANGRFKRQCHVMEIGIVDQYIEDCTNCNPCNERDVEKIKHDTSVLLAKMINEINQIKLFKVQPDDVYKFTTQSNIDQLIIDGKITSASVIHRETHSLTRITRSENKTKRTFDYNNKVKRMYGRFVLWTMCDICQDLTIEYKSKTIEQEIKC